MIIDLFALGDYSQVNNFHFEKNGCKTNTCIVAKNMHCIQTKKNNVVHIDNILEAGLNKKCKNL